MEPPAPPSELPYVLRPGERVAWWTATLAATGIASFWVVGQWLAWPVLQQSSPLGIIAESASLLIVALAVNGVVLRGRERSPAARRIAWGLVVAVALTALVLALRSYLAPWGAWDPERWIQNRAALPTGAVRHLSVLAALAILIMACLQGVQAGGWAARERWRRWGLGVALGVWGLCGFAACSRLAGIPVVSAGMFSISFWTSLCLAMLGLSQALSFGLVPEVLGLFAEDPGMAQEPGAAKLTARPQFWLLLVLGAAGLGLIALFFFLRSQVQSQRTMIAAYLGKVAQLQGQQLAEWRRERMGDARLLRESELLTAMLQGGAPVAVRSPGGKPFATKLDDYRRGHGFDAIVIFNGAMEPVLAVPPGAEKRVAIPASLGLAAREILVLDPPPGPAGEVWVDFVVPVPPAVEGPPGGAMVARVDAAWMLQRKAGRWPMWSSTSELLVARRQEGQVTFVGRTLLRELAPAGGRRIPENWDALNAVVVASRDANEVVDVRDQRNVPVLALARAVPDSPWVVVLKLDRAEAYRSLQVEAWQLGASFFAIIGAVGIAGGAHWRRRRQEYEQRHWRAEALQKEAIERLTKIAGRVPGVVFQYRQYPDGRSCFPFASEAMREVFRLPPEAVREDASAAFRLVHPEDVAGTRTAILESARTLSLFDHEFRVQYDDGTVRWLYSSSSPQQEADGAVLWHGFTTDITARKHAEALLRESLREKEALLKEVHHRVKNNLQVVSSLLRMEARRAGRGTEASVLNEMIGRVHSMALLHESLYRTGTFAAVELGAYIKRIAGDTLRAAVVPPGSVRLRLELERIEVEMDRALPCGLLVNELVSNAFKHGFPSGRTGEVAVRLERLPGGGQARLRVEDTGVGLPANFAQERTNSLGLTLVGDLAVQLDGRLEIGPGPGAVFEVVFRVGPENLRAGSAATPVA